MTQFNKGCAGRADKNLTKKPIAREGDKP